MDSHNHLSLPDLPPRRATINFILRQPINLDFLGAWGLLRDTQFEQGIRHKD